MAFRLTDRHIEQYHKDGFAIFESLIPPALLSDLRAMSERARAVHRSAPGKGLGRIANLTRLGIDIEAFHRFAQLPELAEALHKLIGPDAVFAYPNGDIEKTDIAILLEPPVEGAWCMHWHRDQRDNTPGMDIRAWRSRLLNMRMFNQVNCALFDDNSTWVVPGSHLRDDLPRERALFPTRPILAPDYSKFTSAEESERASLEYCRSMPGAIEVQMHAGDFLLYRNCLWHTGNYASYRKRATLHGSVWTPEYYDWAHNWPKRPDGKTELMNPNAEAPLEALVAAN